MKIENYALKYGLAANVVNDTSDRSPYVPPPVDPEDHAETCGCRACLMTRARKKAN